MIAANVDELNKFLEHDLREPIRFGIGIHGGEVIVGDIGYRDHMVFTALGDAVNVAARLQDMTKSLACEVVVSDEVRATAGIADGTEVDLSLVRLPTDALIFPSPGDDMARPRDARSVTKELDGRLAALVHDREKTP